jgi:hypothetical protein
MKMNKMYRQQVLERMGFSFFEIEIGANAAKAARTKRLCSNFDIENDAKAEKRENIARAVRNVMTLGVKNFMERRYLKRYCLNYGKPNNKKEHVIQLTY